MWFESFCMPFSAYRMLRITFLVLIVYSTIHQNVVHAEKRIPSNVLGWRQSLSDHARQTELARKLNIEDCPLAYWPVENTDTTTDVKNKVNSCFGCDLKRTGSSVPLSSSELQFSGSSKPYRAKSYKICGANELSMAFSIDPNGGSSWDVLVESAWDGTSTGITEAQFNALSSSTLNGWRIKVQRDCFGICNKYQIEIGLGQANDQLASIVQRADISPSWTSYIYVSLESSKISMWTDYGSTSIDFPPGMEYKPPPPQACSLAFGGHSDGSTDQTDANIDQIVVYSSTKDKSALDEHYDDPMAPCPTLPAASASVTPQPSNTQTPPPTSTSTHSAAPTPSTTQTASRTPTPTRTPTSSGTSTSTATSTSSTTSSVTPTSTSTQTPSVTPTSTSTQTPSVTPTSTSTSTPSVTPTSTSTQTPSVTPTSTSTPTSSITPTSTSTPTSSVTPTSTSTPTSSITPTSTSTPTSSVTSSITPTSTSSVTPTITPTPSVTPSMGALIGSISPDRIRLISVRDISWDNTNDHQCSLVTISASGDASFMWETEETFGIETVPKQFNSTSSSAGFISAHQISICYDMSEMQIGEYSTSIKLWLFRGPAPQGLSIDNLKTSRILLNHQTQTLIQRTLSVQLSVIQPRFIVAPTEISLLAAPGGIAMQRELTVRNEGTSNGNVNVSMKYTMFDNVIPPSWISFPQDTFVSVSSRTGVAIPILVEPAVLNRSGVYEATIELMTTQRNEINAKPVQFSVNVELLISTIYKCPDIVQIDILPATSQDFKFEIVSVVEFPLMVQITGYKVIESPDLSNAGLNTNEKDVQDIIEKPNWLGLTSTLLDLRQGGARGSFEGSITYNEITATQQSYNEYDTLNNSTVDSLQLQPGIYTIDLELSLHGSNNATLESLPLDKLPLLEIQTLRLNISVLPGAPTPKKTLTRLFRYGLAYPTTNANSNPLTTNVDTIQMYGNEASIANALAVRAGSTNNRHPLMLRVALRDGLNYPATLKIPPTIMYTDSISSSSSNGLNIHLIPIEMNTTSGINHGSASIRAEVMTSLETEDQLYTVSTSIFVVIWPQSIGNTLIRLSLQQEWIPDSSWMIQVNPALCGDGLASSDGLYCQCAAGSFVSGNSYVLSTKNFTGELLGCSLCSEGSFAAMPNTHTSCTECPPNFYSFDGDSSCHPCISPGFTCNHGKLRMLPGFWCESCTSTNIPQSTRFLHSKTTHSLPTNSSSSYSKLHFISSLKKHISSSIHDGSTSTLHQSNSVSVPNQTLVQQQQQQQQQQHHQRRSFEDDVIQQRRILDDSLVQQRQILEKTVLQQRRILENSIVQQIRQETIFTCPVGSACVVNSTSYHVKCSKGTTGPLCNVCKDGWARVSRTTPCAECWSPGANWSGTLIIIFVFIGIVTFFVYRQLKAWRQVEKLKSASTEHTTSMNVQTSSNARQKILIGIGRITLNYLQVVGVLLSLDSAPTASLKSMFGVVSSTASGSPLDSNPVICALGLTFVPKTYLLLCLPIIIALLAFLAVLGLQRCRIPLTMTTNNSRNTKPIKHRHTYKHIVTSSPLFSSSKPPSASEKSIPTIHLSQPESTTKTSVQSNKQMGQLQRYWQVLGQQLATPVIGLWMVTHMAVSRAALSVYNTTKFPIFGSSRLQEDTSIRTDSSLYGVLSVLAAVVLLLFSFGVPIGLSILLVRRRKRLSENTSIVRWGFLYSGLRTKHGLYLWECLMVILRKVCIVTAATVMAGGLEQSALIYIILSLALLAQLASSPYQSKLLNHLESLQLATLVVTQLASTVIYHNTDSAGANQHLSNGLTVIVFLVNAITSIILLAALILYASDKTFKKLYKLAGRFDYWSSKAMKQVTNTSMRNMKRTFVPHPSRSARHLVLQGKSDGQGNINMDLPRRPTSKVTFSSKFSDRKQPTFNSLSGSTQIDNQGFGMKSPMQQSMTQADRPMALRTRIPSLTDADDSDRASPTPVHNPIKFGARSARKLVDKEVQQETRSDAHMQYILSFAATHIRSNRNLHGRR